MLNKDSVITKFPQVETILNQMKERSVNAGEYIFQENDEDHYFYLVISGEIDIVKKNSDAKDRVIAHLKSGEILGEGALSGIYSKPASAKAITNVELLTLSHENFEQMLKDDCHNGVNFLLSILNVVNGRLNESNVKLLALYEINKLTVQYRDDLPKLLKIFTEKIMTITDAEEGMVLLKNSHSDTYRVGYRSHEILDETIMPKGGIDSHKIVQDDKLQCLYVNLKNLGVLVLCRREDETRFDEDQIHTVVLAAEQVANVIEDSGVKASKKAADMLHQKRFTI